MNQGSWSCQRKSPWLTDRLIPLLAKQSPLLVVDPDEGEAIVTWQWSHQDLAEDMPLRDPLAYDRYTGRYVGHLHTSRSR